MRKILVTFALLLLSHSLNAQWKKIADFKGENQGYTFGEQVSYVYFLDLPGPPRIGFAGTQSELYKTTNGGRSWTKSWGDGMIYGQYFVSGICFKDSLTGWFSMFGGDNVCSRTTDGGNSWTQLNVPDSSNWAEALYYCSGTNRLFISMPDAMEVSSDLGDSWKSVTNFGAGGISFSNDSMGIATAYPTVKTIGIIQTTDGGLVWTIVDTLAACHQPLAIPNMPICFEADALRIIIRRSDDYGRTWRVIKDFGPNEDSNFNEIGPFGTGIIRGDLSHLFIQADSSIFMSIDQGVTWLNEHGPGSLGCVGADNDKFYSANGVTIAGSNISTNGANGTNGIEEGGGLWEEIWPTSGVAERADTASSFRVFPNPAGSSITVERASGLVAVYDPLGRSCTTPQPPPWKGGGVVLDVSGLPSGMYFVSDGVQRTKFIKE